MSYMKLLLPDTGEAPSEDLNEKLSIWISTGNVETWKDLYLSMGMDESQFGDWAKRDILPGVKARR